MCSIHLYRTLQMAESRLHFGKMVRKFHEIFRSSCLGMALHRQMHRASGGGHGRLYIIQQECLESDSQTMSNMDLECDKMAI